MIGDPIFKLMPRITGVKLSVSVPGELWAKAQQIMPGEGTSAIMQEALCALIAEHEAK